MSMNDALEALYSSPEFLIRRAHQIAGAAFAEACAGLDLTPAQYGALVALRQGAPLGQNELGRLIALDRATISLVVRLLRERGLVEAMADAGDRRRTLLALTRAGRQLLARAEKRCARSGAALLSVFEPRQAATFLELLALLDAAHGGGAQ
ncbi:MarR family transcriptional regulator [Roseateles sp. DAIF2]|uniref:MarR family winged helix-turn-helix transcriptional regulator n=1 Tax=Roseateles sp. DAIF2 TaxID=2714952 RepID=UPI0018A2676C|nr:MarR family transcriptional regulator [Roseateles sp. DAIF2]QPF72118.1 MarR family transcriptional regulator [Roseateles sp. DAIF2]